MNLDQEAKDFDEAVTKKVAELVHSNNKIYISEENVLRYRHGGQWSHVDAASGRSNDGSFVEHSAHYTVDMHKIAEHDLTTLLDFISKMTKDMHAQFAHTLFSLVNNQATVVGNVVAIPERTPANETDEEMLQGMLELSKRMELGVNKFGAASYPWLFVHPENRRVLDLIGRPTPPHIQREVDSTNHRKELDAIAREAFRLSGYKR